MELKDVIAISGMSGLYKVSAQTRSGVIVESLADGKKTPVGTNHRISSLADISVFTRTDDLPLWQVLKTIHEKTGGTVSVDLKAEPDALKNYFKGIIEDFDEERVYASDIKKMLAWYLQLKDKLDFEKLGKEEETEETNAGAVANPGQEKPIPKVHESHGPKADQHAKVTPVKLRKKV
jgi:hypothetical protein